LIAVAGPLASLAWALGCAIILRVWGADLDLLTRAVVAFGAVTATMSAAYNGSAAVLRAIDRPGTDGARVRWAMNAHRALRDHERSIGRRLTRAEMLALQRDRRLPDSARLDVRGSVAPPAAR
jgi:hypothetical protein